MTAGSVPICVVGNTTPKSIRLLLLYTALGRSITDAQAMSGRSPADDGAVALAPQVDLDAFGDLPAVGGPGERIGVTARDDVGIAARGSGAHMLGLEVGDGAGGVTVDV